MNRLPESFRESLRLRRQLAALLPDGGRTAVAGLGLLMLTQSLLPAATAVATVALMDGIEAGPGTSLVVPLLAIGGVLFVGQASSSVFFALANLVGDRIDAVHRSRLMVLALSAPTIERLEDDTVQNQLRTARAESEHWVEKCPGDGAVSVLEGVRWVGFAFSAAVVASWSVWLVPILVVPALVARELNRREWVRHFRIWVAGIVHQRRYTYWAEQASTPESAKELRIFGFGDWLVERHQRHLHGHLDDVWEDDARQAWGKWRLFALAAVPLAIVYVIVGLQASHGQGSLALLSAVLGASWGVFYAATGVGDLLDFEGSRPVMAATDELRAVLSDGVALADPTSPPTRALPATPAGRATPAATPRPDPPLVRFEQLTFQYRNARRPVLQDLDLEIRPGELLAIVGANGAGKSTLTKLLAGLYRPSSGRITADGVDVRDLGMAAWRKRLTVVQQDFVRYQLSLTENVALGQVGERAWPELDAAHAAVDDAGFASVAAGLPNGWDTPLTRSRSGGVDLSGGQWQQVALARGLYATRSGAAILVLDEPTAHLDVRTEAELFDRLADITQGVTTVLISHRLSTVRRADRIVLLDGGRITEEGTHDELLAAAGVYAHMFTLQAERFQRGYDDRIEEGELQ